MLRAVFIFDLPRQEFHVSCLSLERGRTATSVENEAVTGSEPCGRVLGADISDSLCASCFAIETLTSPRQVRLRQVTCAETNRQ